MRFVRCLVEVARYPGCYTLNGNAVRFDCRRELVGDRAKSSVCDIASKTGSGPVEWVYSRALASDGNKRIMRLVLYIPVAMNGTHGSYSTQGMFQRVNQSTEVL